MTEQPSGGLEAALDTVLTALPGLSASIEGLTGELAGVKEQLAGQETQLEERRQGEGWLRRYGRKNRAFILLDIVLTAGTAFASLQACEANNAASQTHDYQVSNCVASNKARDDNAHLWETIVALASANARKPQPPGQQASLDRFEAEIHKTFAHRDCSKI